MPRSETGSYSDEEVSISKRLDFDEIEEFEDENNVQDDIEEFDATQVQQPPKKKQKQTVATTTSSAANASSKNNKKSSSSSTTGLRLKSSSAAASAAASKPTPAPAPASRMLTTAEASSSSSSTSSSLQFDSLVLKEVIETVAGSDKKIKIEQEALELNSDLLKLMLLEGIHRSYKSKRTRESEEEDVGVLKEEDFEPILNQLVFDFM